MRSSDLVRRALGAVVALLLVLTAREARAQAFDPAFETPKKTLEVFSEACSRGDFARAAEALDLRQVRVDQRKTRGPELAHDLWTVLDRAVWIDLDAVPDEPKPKADDKTYRVAMVPLRGHDVPITLTSAQLPTKETRWSISAATVAMIPQLFEQYGPGPLESRLPPSIRDPRIGWLYVWQWVGLAVAIPLGFLLGRLAAGAFGFIARRLAARTKPKWDDELVERLVGPTRLFCGLVAVRALGEPLALAANALYVVETALKVGFIGVLGFAAVRIVSVAARSIEARNIDASTSATSLMRARGVTTQVHVLRRVINVGIGVLAVALMLTQFEIVRNLGVSLLASAGVAGVVLGIAAQRTLGTLIAGIQLSATQLVRIGDDVVVEKETGVIEEITLTYVVVRVWDERRLIVPMTRFLEQPFENWSRLSTAIHGTVFVTADPSLPVSAIRAEVDRIVVGDPVWDNRTKSVAVVDAGEHAMQIRVLLSAINASALTELRHRVRERLLAWLASFEGGRYLVRTRFQAVEGASGVTSPVAAPPTPGPPTTTAAMAARDVSQRQPA